MDYESVTSADVRTSLDDPYTVIMETCGTRYDPDLHVIFDTPPAWFESLVRSTQVNDGFLMQHRRTGNLVLCQWMIPRKLFVEVHAWDPAGEWPDLQWWKNRLISNDQKAESMKQAVKADRDFKAMLKADSDAQHRDLSNFYARKDPELGRDIENMEFRFIGDKEAQHTTPNSGAF